MAGFFPAPTNVALTVYEVALAANVTLNQNTLTTVLQSPTLPVGTYVVDFSASVLIGASGESIDFTSVMSSGAGTFAGQYSDTIGYTTAVGGGALPKSAMNFTVVVTTPGVVTIEAEMAGAATASTVLATSHTNGYTNVTGAIFTKVD